MSDAFGRRYGMRGRIWAHFLMLLGEGLMLYAFGSVRKELGWIAALLVAERQACRAQRRQLEC